MIDAICECKTLRLVILDEHAVSQNDADRILKHIPECVIELD